MHTIPFYMQSLSKKKNAIRTLQLQIQAISSAHSTLRQENEQQKAVLMIKRQQVNFLAQMIYLHQTTLKTAKLSR